MQFVDYSYGKLVQMSCKTNSDKKPCKKTTFKISNLNNIPAIDVNVMHLAFTTIRQDSRNHTVLCTKRNMDNIQNRDYHFRRWLKKCFCPHFRNLTFIVGITALKMINYIGSCLLETRNNTHFSIPSFLCKLTQ